MAYEVRYSNRAVEQLKKLRAYDRATILHRIEEVLMVDPRKVSKTTIKLLKRPAPTQYRLRAGEFRVLYDVERENVWVVEILSKEDAIAYLGRNP